MVCGKRRPSLEGQFFSIVNQLCSVFFLRVSSFSYHTVIYLKSWMKGIYFLDSGTKDNLFSKGGTENTLNLYMCMSILLGISK